MRKVAPMSVALVRTARSIGTEKNIGIKLQTIKIRDSHNPPALLTFHSVLISANNHLIAIVG